MEALKINGTDDTPSIILDAENNAFHISGKSLPEDVYSFYKPILDWFKAYAESPNPKTVLEFKFIYFNTATSRIIIDILFLIEKIHKNKHDVAIKWFYPDDDEDLKDAGEEFAYIVKIPFEHISYPDI